MYYFFLGLIKTKSDFLKPDPCHLYSILQTLYFILFCVFPIVINSVCGEEFNVLCGLPIFFLLLIQRQRGRNMRAEDATRVSDPRR